MGVAGVAIVVGVVRVVPVGVVPVGVAGVVEELSVRFRLSHGQGEESENYKELHAEACWDCLVPTVII